jgi:signal transduction histidine kinase/CHASE2 domain-containing sensor protein
VGLVLIDDLSLSRYGRWPWPRHLLARLVRATSAQQPATIGLDILLSEPGDPEGDNDLAKALRDAGNVVLAAKLSSSPQRLWADPRPLFLSNSAGLGHVQAVEDADGICRSIPLRELSLDGPRWALAVAVARVARHASQEPRSNGSGWQSYAPEFLAIDFRRPLESAQPVSPFVTASAADLLEGRAEPAFHGKAVLIGFAATELSDRVPTPVSGQMPMPGVEVHANLLDGLLSGRTLRHARPWPQVLFLAAFSLASTWLVLRWPLWNGLLLQAALLGISYATGYWLFAHRHQMIEFGPVFCAGVLAVPLAQLRSLVVVNRGLTRGLRQLRHTLQIGRSPQELTNLSAFDQRETSSDLEWRVELVNGLQTELGSLYAFRQNLLESMQEGLAVFAPDGNILFRNRCWDAFCERQGRDPKMTLGEFARVLGHPAWVNVEERVRGDSEDAALTKQTRSALESEVQLKGSFWQVRGVRLPSSSGHSGSQWMVVVTDLTSIQERDEARADALRFVTHELRTPLVAIQGFAEYLQRYPQASGSPAAAATIFRESQRLVSLINTYLDVLRFDAGARSIRRELVSIPEMVSQVQRVMSPIAEAAEIRIEVTLQRSLPSLEGDAPMLSGVLLNLLNNAVKYSPAGSQVTLRVTATEATITFEVRNPGPPIPPEDMSRLFEPFYRTRTADDSGAGWGLGLTFVKRIVEEHAGSLDAHSDSAGISVRVNLPTASRAPGPGQPGPIDPVG